MTRRPSLSTQIPRSPEPKTDPPNSDTGSRFKRTKHRAPDPQPSRAARHAHRTPLTTPPGLSSLSPKVQSTEKPGEVEMNAGVNKNQRHCTLIFRKRVFNSAATKMPFPTGQTGVSDSVKPTDAAQVPTRGQSGPRLWLHQELWASWQCPSILSTRSRRRASAFTSTLTNLHRVLLLTRDKDTPSHCPAHSTQHRQQVRVLQRGGLAQGAEPGEQPGRPWAWRSEPGQRQEGPQTAQGHRPSTAF